MPFVQNQTNDFFNRLSRIALQHPQKPKCWERDPYRPVILCMKGAGSRVLPGIWQNLHMLKFHWKIHVISTHRTFQCGAREEVTCADSGSADVCCHKHKKRFAVLSARLIAKLEDHPLLVLRHLIIKPREKKYVSLPVIAHRHRLLIPKHLRTPILCVLRFNQM